jgi:hypothetical protein
MKQQGFEVSFSRLNPVILKIETVRGSADRPREQVSPVQEVDRKPSISQPARRTPGGPRSHPIQSCLATTNRWSLIQITAGHIGVSPRREYLGRDRFASQVDRGFMREVDLPFGRVKIRTSTMGGGGVRICPFKVCPRNHGQFSRDK